MAREMVGDGKSPNKFFVTSSPWYNVTDEYGDIESELIDGFEDNNSETRVFDSLEEAEEYYEEVDLDIYDGIASVLIEDRKTGTIKEKYLEKIVRVEYTMIEHDDTKHFGYKK
jgi:hypothetical protein